MRQIIRFLIIDSAYPINTRNIKIANSLCKHYSDREVQMIFVPGIGKIRILPHLIITIYTRSIHPVDNC